ncbi:hypothetical protein WCLP8_4160001 [uncultured Gammaproteobacteria bacterium]
MVNLFFENSTRTRTSFELAGLRLGGIVGDHGSIDPAVDRLDHRRRAVARAMVQGSMASTCQILNPNTQHLSTPQHHVAHESNCRTPADITLPAMRFGMLQGL